MAREISPKDLFGFLRKKFKINGGVHTDEHENLSEEDRIVEDYLLVGYYVVDKMKIKNVICFEFDINTYPPLKAITDGGSVIELNLGLYVNSETPDNQERLMEAEAISANLNIESAQNKIRELSREYYKNI